MITFEKGTNEDIPGVVILGQGAFVPLHLYEKNEKLYSVLVLSDTAKKMQKM